MTIGLVCSHVLHGSPVLVVAHQAPQDPDDSGLTVSCGLPSHPDEQWLVENLEPLLTGLPRPGLAEVAFRQSADEPWAVDAIQPAQHAA